MRVASVQSASCALIASSEPESSRLGRGSSWPRHALVCGSRALFAPEPDVKRKTTARARELCFFNCLEQLGIQAGKESVAVPVQVMAFHRDRVHERDSVRQAARPLAPRMALRLVVAGSS